ncbi:MAG UNVERIFIED_CONTAM: YCF48-related protein, partial [Thermobifida fusca]
MQQLPLTPVDVDFVDPDTGFVVTENGQLAKTDDGGKSWHLVHEFNEHIAEIDFVSSSVGWAMAQDGIWSTTDSGASWTKVPTPFLPGFVDLTGETVAWAIDHELQLFYTLDGGINWERKVSPCSSIETLASWSASFISSHEGWFICGSDEGMGGQSKTLLRTEDAAATWEVVAAIERDQEESQGSLPAGGYVADLFFLDRNTGWFATSRYGEVWTTQDGGASWHQVNEAPPGVQAFVRLDFVSKQVGWGFLFVADGWHLAQTRDGGATWDSVTVTIRPGDTSSPMPSRRNARQKAPSSLGPR